MNMYKLKKLEQERGIALEEFIKENFPLDEAENYFRLARGESLTPEMEEKVETWDKETRTNEEFYLNFIYTGIKEIFAIRKLLDFLVSYKGGTWTYSFHGADSKRVFHSAKDANDNPDCIIANTLTGNSFYIELMDDNSGYAKRFGILDLRNRKTNISKWESLVKHSKEKKTFLMVSDYAHNAIGLIPINEKVTVLKKDYINNAYNGRRCTQIAVDYKKWFHSLNKSVAA